MKILKWNKPIYNYDISETGWLQDGIVFYLCRQYRGDKEIPDGKIALSLKSGKKRVLVKGIISSCPCSCPQTGLSFEVFFKPTTCIQRHKIKKFVS